MRDFVFRGIAASVIAVSLVAWVSCARDQQLESIQVIPTTEIFGSGNIPVNLDAGLAVQLRALGHYIHPPVTKDITNQVIWGSNDPQMVTVNSTGLITATGGACGGTVVSATIQTGSSSSGRSSSGAIVTGSMNANVVCFGGAGSGGGPNPILGVSIAGTGSVTSSPTGINCPGTCSSGFASGTPITLTATPSGSATGVNWAGCFPSGLTCTITLTANSSVSATFF